MAELLYDAGQNLKESYFNTQELPENKFEAALLFLKNGFTGLYYHSTDTIAFSNFEKAYILAKELNYKPLLKQVILAKLELFYNEMLQSNNLHIDYLKEYEALVEDDIDRFHFYLFQSIFRAKSIFEIEKLSSQNVNELIRLFENSELEWPNPILAKYYYEIGIHATFDNNLKLGDSNFNLAINNANAPFLKYIKYGSYLRKGILKAKDLDYDEALRLLKISAVHYDKQDSLKSSFYTNRYAAEFYQGLKKYDSALFVLKKSIQLENEIQFRENTMEISRLNAKYQTVEKEKQILEEQQKVRANRNWLIAAGIVLFLGAGIALLFQKNTTKKRLLAEQETILKQQRVDNLLKEQELVSIDAMIAGQEKERQRVANELHDDLGSLMATIKLHFDNAKISKKDPALQNAQKLLDQAYQKVRGMAHSKNSGVMSDQGLLPAIKKMAQVITETNALEVVVEAFGMGDRLENSLELNLFRMVQELVANTIKHAEATKVTIQFTQHEDNLNIIIEDNGKGFDRSKIETDKTGMGLTTIEKRVEHLEGNFTIDSILGKGTSILIDIPV
ncbi:sensor histidine kinase [Croceitalea rosinachiae]|uniref:Oxygen sensor histidine kinase NreB n=1 Tax=Croceitalea rosinachiae TaxID=3075596 RepID=A0ABU3A7F1_9FLAO|nr:sensor histidine kinase [Croceitalea sp. F388]MDT0606101.1 sensor histidine kinase [Croceitalea sp. F388]